MEGEGREGAMLTGWLIKRRAAVVVYDKVTVLCSCFRQCVVGTTSQEHLR